MQETLEGGFESGGLIGALPVGVCIIDRYLEIRCLNASMMQLLDGGGGHYFPDIAEAIRGPVDEVLREDHTVENVQIVASCPPFRTFLATVFPFDAGKTRDAVGLVLRDITEYKLLQDARRHARRSEMIERLAGGVAHDYNNLLTSILGNATLLSEAVAHGRAISGMVNEIIEASERAAELTRQLLAYAGKGSFIRAPVVLSELMRRSQADLCKLASPNIELRFALPPGLPAVEGDPAQLMHLIEILLRNAIEAIGNERVGSVEVRVFEDPAEELAGVPQPVRRIRVEVSDDGCGMEDEVRLRAFEPFFTTKFPGRGLGLAAAMGIVRSGGGQIQIQSQSGCGSKVTVIWPVVEASSPYPAANTCA